MVSYFCTRIPMATSTYAYSRETVSTNACKTTRNRMNQWKMKWKFEKPKPEPLLQDVWDKLTEYWDNHTTRTTSAKKGTSRKKSRRGKGMAVHCSGAKSFLHRQAELFEETGVVPDHLTLMRKTYTNKNGVIVDGLMKEILESTENELEERKIALSQSQGIDVSEVTIDTDDVNKMVLQKLPKSRGRCVGLGSVPHVPPLNFDNRKTQLELEETKEELAQIKTQCQEAEERSREAVNRSQQLEDLLVSRLGEGFRLPPRQS